MPNYHNMQIITSVDGATSGNQEMSGSSESNQPNRSCAVTPSTTGNYQYTINLDGLVSLRHYFVYHIYNEQRAIEEEQLQRLRAERLRRQEIRLLERQIQRLTRAAPVPVRDKRTRGL